jgi:DNA replication protein DnaC
MKQFSEILNQLPSKSESCGQHGDYESKNYFGRIWSKCPECSLIEYQEAKEKDEAEARRNKRLEWEKRIGAAGIPERFQTRTLDAFDADTPEKSKAKEFALEYAKNFASAIKTGRCALFVGRPGTGKTHLAAGIGLRIMGAENRTVLFTTVMRAVRRVKDTWTKGSAETETQAIAAMTYPDLLILDEVGVQFGSEFEKNIMFDVLNERYEKRRPTILLSNLTKDELVGFLGERVYDRMKEDNGKFVAFDWESYRGKK